MDLDAMAQAVCDQLYDVYSDDELDYMRGVLTAAGLAKLADRELPADWRHLIEAAAIAEHATYQTLLVPGREISWQNLGPEAQRLKRLSMSAAFDAAGIADLFSEIDRHHVDFARWEEMAASGAGKAAEMEELRSAFEDLLDARSEARDVLDLARASIQRAHALLEETSDDTSRR